MIKVFDGRLPFGMETSKPGYIETASLTLLYISIYIKDVASSWMSNVLAGSLLAIGMVLGFASITMSRRLLAHGAGRYSMPLLAGWLMIWILTLAATGNVNYSSYYVAIPCAIIVVNTRPRFFIKVLLIHLALTLLIQSGEYFGGQYLFIYEASDGTVLDEILFGGGLGIFRAKGLFQGPLSAVAFALWIAFLLRGSVFSVAALFVCAFFASGRLGMLTATLLMLVRLLGNGRSSNGMATKIPLLAGLAVVVGLLFAYSDENRLFFILNALDIGNDQNVSRTTFWLTSLTHYLSYSPLEQLLGNYGFIQLKEGGTENDFLRLLLDCGLLGFLIYFCAIAVLLVRALRRRDREDLAITVLIVVLMNIFPFIQSLSSGLLFWVYFFSTMNRKCTMETSDIRRYRNRRLTK